MIQKPSRGWVDQLITLTKDGGVWGWPDQQATYRLDKKAKTLTRLAGPDGDPHEYVRECFALCGWEVKP